MPHEPSAFSVLRRRPRRHPGAAVLGVAVALVLLPACGDGDDAGTSDSTSPGPTPAAGAGSPTETTAVDGEGTEGTAVTIAGYAFAPTPLVARTGDTVMWTNEDDFAHKVTSDDDAWTPSEEIASGGTFAVTLDEAGTYAYHCGIHNYMEGVVVVEDA